MWLKMELGGDILCAQKLEQPTIPQGIKLLWHWSVFLLVANFMLEVAKDDSVSLSKLDVYSIYSPQITEVDL